MARGGARSGAGRKPGGSDGGGVVLGMDGARRVHRAAELPPAVSPEEVAALLEPPAGLPETVKACWRELAPKAIARHTLTLGAAPGFENVCVTLAYVRALDAKLLVLGAASQEGLPYLAHRVRAATSLTAGLKDFKLTAFGKPETTDKPKAAANPWAQVAGK